MSNPELAAAVFADLRDARAQVQKLIAERDALQRQLDMDHRGVLVDKMIEERKTLIAERDELLQHKENSLRSLKSFADDVAELRRLLDEHRELEVKRVNFINKQSAARVTALNERDQYRAIAVVAARWQERRRSPDVWDLDNTGRVAVAGAEADLMRTLDTARAAGLPLEPGTEEGR